MLPNTIILDTGLLMRRLRQMADVHDEYPEFADDMAQELIDRVTDLRTVNYRLRSFIEDVHAGHHNDRDDGFAQIDPRYARLLSELGCTILEQLRHLRAYYPDGHLPYHFHLPHVPENHHINDIMLTLTGALPYRDEQYAYAQLLAA